MVTGAERLNDKWDALAERLDLLKSVPESDARAINYTISDWQDWYWGNQDAWPSDELLDWQEKYTAAALKLDGLAAKTVVVSDVTKTDYYQKPKKKVVHLPPLLITARPPPPPYVPPPPVVYSEAPGVTTPAPARVRFAGLGAVDVSEWERMNLPSFVAYSRDPGTAGWVPSDRAVQHNRGGLIALIVGIVGTVAAKRAGWL